MNQADFGRLWAAALSGLTLAQETLADLFATAGRALEACEWLTRAATSGRQSAVTRLGRWEIVGFGGAQDIARGLSQVVACADAGHAIKPDNLNDLNRNYAQTPLTTPVFLNSVPKCGTHLMRNIIRMFVPVEQQYHKAFIQHPNLRQHMAAFSPASPRLSWGHLLFSDDATIALRQVHHIVLVRDPYDWVLARARFFLSDAFKGPLEHLKGGNVSVEEALNMMIFGVHDKAPTLQEIFLHNAVSWLGTHARFARYEDLIRSLGDLESAAAEAYFTALLKDCGIDRLPDDWRARIRVGSDRNQSGTARENLGGPAANVPNELPDTQKKLVDFAAPGLRQILGYG